MSYNLSPLPLVGEVAVSAAGEGPGSEFGEGQLMPQEPSPGPERPTSPPERGNTATDIDCSIPILKAAVVPVACPPTVQ
jgi:hypothetical protein